MGLQDPVFSGRCSMCVTCVDCVLPSTHYPVVSYGSFWSPSTQTKQLFWSWCTQMPLSSTKVPQLIQSSVSVCSDVCCVCFVCACVFLCAVCVFVCFCVLGVCPVCANTHYFGSNSGQHQRVPEIQEYVLEDDTAYANRPQVDEEQF